MNVEILTEDQAVQSAAFPIEVKVYANGAQRIPTAATITVKDPDGTAQVAAAVMTIDAVTGTLTYALSATYTATLWENAVIEVAYTVDSVAHRAYFFFDVVLQRLKCNVVDADLKAYLPKLGDWVPKDETGFTAQIGEAFMQVKQRIRDKGKRPAMLLDGAQVRELIIVKAFEIIFFSFAKSETDIWWLRYGEYKALFEKRFEALRVKYDVDESGTIDADETEAIAQPQFQR